MGRGLGGRNILGWVLMMRNLVRAVVAHGLVGEELAVVVVVGSMMVEEKGMGFERFGGT